ncbi:MAG TPA: preprotein translocase subunit SecE [Bacillota bacterium]|nr:preprotein translocase subunit SecE [Bacillota bacterium]HPT87584.1 preprotein translocase subunit SecE [Bacillota bacterium]
MQSTTKKEVGFQGISKFFRNVQAELKKVNWPNRKELTTYTIVVIVTVLVLAVVIFFWDSLLTLFFNLLGFYQ